jgi:hypothetical protein
MVNLKPDTKERFDRLQPESDTQDEFVQTLLDRYEAGDEPVIIDHEDIEQHIESAMSVAEAAAYRGTTEALERYD